MRVSLLQLLASPQPADMAVVVLRVESVSVPDDTRLTSALRDSRLPLFVFEVLQCLHAFPVTHRPLVSMPTAFSKSCQTYSMAVSRGRVPPDPSILSSSISELCHVYAERCALSGVGGTPEADACLHSNQVRARSSLWALRRRPAAC